MMSFLSIQQQVLTVNVSKTRLDQEIVSRRLVTTRSQAESYIKLGLVKVNGNIEHKAGRLVSCYDEITLTVGDQFVSRAALKLSSVSKKLNLDFRNKVVLDVGSSTGGFTDFALKHGATKVIAVELGTQQMHPSLRSNSRIELYEKTDIREFAKRGGDLAINIVVADVSFISLKEILPSVTEMIDRNTQIVAMVKPQFEAKETNFKHKGVIKNQKMRRQILQDFESWTKKLFVIIDKADSEVAGTKGNVERFYLLKPKK